MTSKLLVTVLVFSLFVPPAIAEDINRRDGNWWRQRTDVMKRSYVLGFLDGMNLGRNFSYSGMTVDGEMDTDMGGKVLKAFHRLADNFLKNPTTVQLADGLDQLYEDYRNRAIPLHDAVWLVLNTIAGKPDKEMQAIIEAYRRAAAKR